VSAPADIQGGDAVAEERPSGVSDALSVRSMPNSGPPHQNRRTGTNGAAFGENLSFCGTSSHLFTMFAVALVIINKFNVYVQ